MTDETSYCSITEYKIKFPNIKFQDATIIDALNTSAIRLRNKIFIPSESVITQTTTEWKLITPLGDIDMDGEITKDDIEFYELDSDYIETDRHDNIISFQPKYGYIKTDISLPTPGNKLYIKYRYGKRDISFMIDDVKRLNALMATDYMFNNMGLEQLQNGITSWIVNDQHVTIDSNSIELIKKSNQKEIIKLMNQLTPYVAVQTPMGYDRDTPGVGSLLRGNVYNPYR